MQCNNTASNFLCSLTPGCCRRWKGGTIEPHPTENALIVNYKLEAAVFSEQPNDPMLEQKKVPPWSPREERAFLYFPCH